MIPEYMKNIPGFSARFEKNYDELKWLFFELYPDRTKEFDELLRTIRQSYEGRSAELKERDVLMPAEEKAALRPHASMTLNAKSWAGSFAGLKEKLPYLYESGVRMVRLLPCYESAEGRNDGGYAIVNYHTADPALGSITELREIADACHELGMELCLEFVMNHTGDMHPWAMRAKKGERLYQDRYFFYDDWFMASEYERYTIPVLPYTSPGHFTWCPELRKVVLTTFRGYEWDLNYTNPLVFVRMVENYLFYCNLGADVIRLDSISYLWKMLGTSSRNLPRTHTLLRMLRMVSEIAAPSVRMLGEAALSPTEAVSYFGTGEKPECHMMTNVSFPALFWHTVAAKDTRLLKKEITTFEKMPEKNRFTSYLHSHDDIVWNLDFNTLNEMNIEQYAHLRFLNSYYANGPFGAALYDRDPQSGSGRITGRTATLDGIEAAEQNGDAKELAKAVRLHIMLHALLLSISGYSEIYYGDELGLCSDRSERVDPDLQEDTRYLQRGPMDWAAADRRNDREQKEGKIFSALRTMNLFRETLGVFHADASVTVPEGRNSSIFAIGRKKKKEELLAVFNFGERSETYRLEEGNYRDLLQERTVSGNTVEIPAGDFIWLYRD